MQRIISPKLADALRALRVWESQAVDLAYGADDPRSNTPDYDMPSDYITERDALRARVTREAARQCGETSDDASAYADNPTNPDNPYNIDRVRLAAAIFGVK